jgi:hypothetical protein
MKMWMYILIGLAVLIIIVVPVIAAALLQKGHIKLPLFMPSAAFENVKDKKEGTDVPEDGSEPFKKH